MMLHNFEQFLKNPYPFPPSIVTLFCYRHKILDPPLTNTVTSFMECSYPCWVNQCKLFENTLQRGKSMHKR